MDILSGLNQAQREAVECLEGPLLIMAGAGSGKTRVLTHRIANLLEHGVAPYNILAITFTNKAATEMRERVERMIGEGSRDIWLSTFHSFCAKFLRREIEATGMYKNNFVIYDTSDQKTVIKRALKELNLDEKQYTPGGIGNAISNAKNQMMGPQAFERQAADFVSKKIAEVYKLYQKTLRQNNALDFDDLLMVTVALLNENQEVLQKYQRRFKYIMVDEYQDTNGAQYQLTKLLADGYRNLCVVGDADQSIYGWRGADISNIRNFKKDYPEGRRIMLEQNYRSTKTILAAANAVIENNDNREPKNLWTENVAGEKITTYLATDERDEARFITDAIVKQHTLYHTSYGDMAILYRTNAQSRVLEEGFMRSGLPYTMVGGLKFYERKEIKDILAYLRVLHDPMDAVSLQRIVNVPKRGLGQTTIDKLMIYSMQQEISLFEVIANPDYLKAAGLTARSINPLQQFAGLIFQLMERVEKLAVSDLLTEVMETTGYIKALKEDKDEKKIENESRIENLREFVGVAKEFEKETADEPTLENFLANMALMSDIDESDMEAERVTLMTLHSAKGLEFPVVFMAGMEEGMFPHARTLMEPLELEEERRTCYVGITRAQRKLYMTYAGMRTIYGRTNVYEPSRFLAEIPAELKDELEARRRGFGGNDFNGSGYGGGSYGYGGFNRNNGSFTSRKTGQDSNSGTSFTPQFSNNSAQRTGTKGQPMSGMEALAGIRGLNPTLGGSIQTGAQAFQQTGPGITSGAARPQSGKIQPVQRSGLTKPDMSIQWKTGDKAEHSKWGIGTVVAVSGQGEETALTLDFPGEGVKKLMQKYAPIKKV